MVGAGVALAPGNLVALVVNAQVLNGIITPMLLTYVLILANRKKVLGDAVNGRVFKVVATLCISVVAVLSFVVLLGRWLASSEPDHAAGLGVLAIRRSLPRGLRHWGGRNLG